MPGKRPRNTRRKTVPSSQRQVKPGKASKGEGPRPVSRKNRCEVINAVIKKLTQEAMETTKGRRFMLTINHLFTRSQNNTLVLELAQLSERELTEFLNLCAGPNPREAISKYAPRFSDPRRINRVIAIFAAYGICEEELRAATDREHFLNSLSLEDLIFYLGSEILRRRKDLG